VEREMIATSKKSQADVKLVLGAIETVFDKHRIEAIDEYFAPDFVQHSPYVPPGGRKELAAWWRGTVEAIPDIRGTIEHVVAIEESVAVFRTLKGTIKKDMPSLGIKASDQAIEFKVAHLFQTRNGRIIAHWEIMDSGPATRLATGAR
jgi:predicted SnoaL-like aldol condensation-catalyzing enzyme